MSNISVKTTYNTQCKEQYESAMVKSNVDSDHIACLQRKTIGKQHVPIYKRFSESQTPLANSTKITDSKE